MQIERRWSRERAEMGRCRGWYWEHSSHTGSTVAVETLLGKNIESGGGGCFAHSALCFSFLVGDQWNTHCRVSMLVAQWPLHGVDSITPHAKCTQCTCSTHAYKLHPLLVVTHLIHTIYNTADIAYTINTIYTLYDMHYIDKLYIKYIAYTLCMK
jgi:hypothetical protein